MRGIVTHTSGRPAAGVSVSNGRAVVRTDADGRFGLPDEGEFVMLTRPTGSTAAPWWHRRADVDADDIRFELVPEEQPLPYRFVHLTDTHLTVPRDPDEDGALEFGLYREGSLPHQLSGFLRALPARVPGVRSVMITGDLVDHGLPEEYEAYLGALADSPVPVHLIPGNHDHMNGRHGSVVSRNNYLTNTGTPELYERYIGPRWYSFDVAGLHVVALDWHTHELGLDHEVQNAWVKADLGALPDGSPWILLFHDQPAASILDEVPWQPVAAFSGHWHTSRVVEVNGTLHVNSPTTFFASLDYSPPAFRVVTWDGTGIQLATQTLLTVEPAEALGDVSTATFAPSANVSDHRAVRWRAGLAGAAHRQRLAVDRGMIFAGGQIEDRAAGTVEAIDLPTGEPLWRHETSSAVKTTPAPAGPVVIAAEVSGDVTALDRETGDLVWRVPSSDPLRRFAWGGVTVADGRAYVGDPSDLRAIDVATGEVLWRRTDLSPHHNLVNHAAPLVVDDLLVMGFWPTPMHPVGLDAATGATRWATAEMGDDPFESFKRLLIMGTAAFDGTHDAVLMPAFGHTTVVDRRTGAHRWTAPHEGGFSPATPVVTDAGYLVTVTGRGIRMLDPETGATRWDRAIDGDAPFPMASYTKAPHPTIAPPVLVDGTLVLPGLDGKIRRYALDGGRVGEAQLASPLAAALVDGGEVLVGVGVDGSVLALDRSVAS